ncbi:MAG: ATP-binding protein [Lentisphaerae bacterium]|nr:ATP-binding protein [Lentisphaerota bacterium]
MSDISFPTVTIAEAKKIISAMAHKQSILLLSAPGVGKSDAVRQAAAAAGLECTSLLGTQIAPEDVSGIPRIVGERSVFCPPRILLPENPEKFCLFLDELPACSPDIQKAFYSLLLERRLGEHKLPEGTWVVAAGNRAEDRSLVRSLSAALVNRTIILQVRVDVKEWIQWAIGNHIREDIISYILLVPQALQRPVPNLPVPFSTPRAWASLSQAMDLLEAEGSLTESTTQAVVFGSVSAEDAAIFMEMQKISLSDQQKAMKDADDYIFDPNLLPETSEEKTNPMRWFVLQKIHNRILEIKDDLQGWKRYNDMTPEICNNFFQRLSNEEKVTVMLNCVPVWGKLGADETLIELFFDLTGIEIKA